MSKDGGAAFPVQQLCKNCGKPSGYHTWVTRKCPNGITYEEYDHDSAALLAGDAAREGEDG
jgi:hypothetical protein